ncbi:MAG: cytochrome c oxidase subunit II [Actinomycetota bacterium]|nr:cytochrome c oxidase subunit II [Actinomycetota bacterium]
MIVATPPPLTDQADDIEQVWDLFLVIAVGVGVFVVGLIAYAVIRFRRRDDSLPSQVHYNIPMEVAYTAIPLLVVIGLFVITFTSVRAIDRGDDDPDLVVEVVGFQWQWQFGYPESGVVVVGNASTDPELVLPTGASVEFEMTSLDVIHSFWIPGFRFKRDIFPGETTTFQVDVGERTGFYQSSGVCAEFCGLDHHKMRFSVRIVTPAEFEQWAADR